ncbi:MAG: N-acetyltransferase [Calditrichaeota bacterium]|nr:GNAT family N-acetyltransferase [Calditrichota bacterium]RQW07747.1 MAG: N-acetyltransferase [Calditrichota bacterium]
MFFSDMERQNPSMHHYLAFYEGIPAGCGTLFPAAGAGGIYYIGTLPQFRRRGVGEAVTRHCVKESCEAGYPLVVLRASDEGELLYRRLGFEEFLRFRLYRRQGIFVSSSKWKISVYCRRVYHKITGDASWFC